MPNQLEDDLALTPFPFAPSTTYDEAWTSFEARVEPDARFQYALEKLAPIVRGDSDALLFSLSEEDRWATRCFSAYTLYRLYAPHPLAVNPFASVFQDAINRLSSTTGTESPFDVPLRQCLHCILRDEGAKLDHVSPRLSFRKARDGRSTATLSPSSGSADVASRPATPNGGTSESNVTRYLVEARDRVLSLSEQRKVLKALPSTPHHVLCDAVPPSALSSIVQKNGRIASAILDHILSSSSDLDEGPHPIEGYIEVLKDLPPTLSSFDLLGTLLKPKPNNHPGANEAEENSSRGSVIRLEVVEPFIARCLMCIDEYEREDEENANDEFEYEVDEQGRTARTVRMLSKFVLAVLKSDELEGPTREDPPDGAVSRSASSSSGPSSSALPPHTSSSRPIRPQPRLSEPLEIELTNFALQHSRFVEANTLYRALVTGAAGRAES